MIQRTIDDDTGIIHVSGSGTWTRAMVDEHYAAMRTIVAAIRGLGQPVRVLSDVTNADRQSPRIEDHIKWQMERTFRPGDRIAVLAGTTEVKTILTALIALPAIVAFQSRMAAETWLMADGIMLPG